MALARVYQAATKRLPCGKSDPPASTAPRGTPNTLGWPWIFQCREPSSKGSQSSRKPAKARARLMRLSDQDGALVSEYAKARIAAVAAQMVGPAEARRYGQRDTSLAFINRRNPERARQLAALKKIPQRLALSHGLPSDAAAEVVLRYAMRGRNVAI